MGIRTDRSTGTLRIRRLFDGNGFYAWKENHNATSSHTCGAHRFQIRKLHYRLKKIRSPSYSGFLGTLTPMIEATAPVKTTAFTVALIGNPNVGKTTIFNRLTGLRQKVGNYPGVTVDKRSGKVQHIPEKVTLVDLPGTYSIHPNTENEIIVHRVLNGLDKQSKPDYVLAVVDMSNLERGLFLVTQVMDLGLPMAVILNMEDTAKAQGIVVKTHQLYKALGVPLIQTNARSNKGMKRIEALVSQQLFETPRPFLNMDKIVSPALTEEIRKEFNLNPYQVFQLIRF